MVVLTGQVSIFGCPARVFYLNHLDELLNHCQGYYSLIIIIIIIIIVVIIVILAIVIIIMVIVYIAIFCKSNTGRF